MDLITSEEKVYVEACVEECEDIANSICEIVDAFDEPFGNSSVIPSYFCGAKSGDLATRGAETTQTTTTTATTRRHNINDNTIYCHFYYNYYYGYNYILLLFPLR